MTERVVEYKFAGFCSPGEPSEVQLVPEPDFHVSRVHRRKTECEWIRA